MPVHRSASLCSRTFSVGFLPTIQPPSLFRFYVVLKYSSILNPEVVKKIERMRLLRLFILLSCTLTLTYVTATPNPQEPAFELPVQLVGFPVIIAAVRISNFVKKLAYSLNPQTYSTRARRSYPGLREDIPSVGEVEKKLVSELGNNVCIYERICSEYAQRTLRRRKEEHEMDWSVIFSQYKSSPDPMKENYLLSVFLGDIIGSPRLCRQLAKRGRGCIDFVATD